MAVLFTKMSSEEVMGDKSLIFDIIGGEKSRTKDGVPGHQCRRALPILSAPVLLSNPKLSVYVKK